uniref:Uncharacterized protein n=1 Tax=Pararge aegeria TaxID=116150 RepID=S4PKP3_9NEOP
MPRRHPLEQNTDFRVRPVTLLLCFALVGSSCALLEMAMEKRQFHNRTGTENFLTENPIRTDFVVIRRLYYEYAR